MTIGGQPAGNVVRRVPDLHDRDDAAAGRGVRQRPPRDQHRQRPTEPSSRASSPTSSTSRRETSSTATSPPSSPTRITAGIGGGFYGVTDNTLRQQMAVFILKAKHGLCYTPPPCAGVFPDVPCASNFAPWIEAMAAEGITGGCGGGNYCPQNPVRRDQMAVFLLKAEHGSAYVPPAVRRPLSRRRLSVHVRRLDRAARHREHHRRLRKRQLLPGQPEHPRPDGGVHHEGVRPAVALPARCLARGVHALHEVGGKRVLTASGQEPASTEEHSGGSLIVLRRRLTDGTRSRQARGTVPDRGPDRCGRDGRGIPGLGRETSPRRCRQGPSSARSPRTGNSWPASSGRRWPSRRSRTPTFFRSSTSGRTAASLTPSRSCSRVRPCARGSSSRRFPTDRPSAMRSRLPGEWPRLTRRASSIET